MSGVVLTAEWLVPGSHPHSAVRWNLPGCMLARPHVYLHLYLYL
jgi:hypothetical protein